MDVNEALERIRKVVAQIRDDETAMTMDVYAALEEITDAAEALDEWLTRGGFLPADWHLGR